MLSVCAEEHADDPLAECARTVVVRPSGVSSSSLLPSLPCVPGRTTYAQMWYSSWDLCSVLSLLAEGADPPAQVCVRLEESLEIFFLSFPRRALDFSRGDFRRQRRTTQANS